MSDRHQEVSLFPDVKPSAWRGPLVGSVIDGSNADLIAAVGPIWLEGRTVVDVTYGKGNWWTKWRPDNLVGHDLSTDGVDFTALPYPDGAFDVVVFDPPYIPAGGADTSTVPGFQAAYGVAEERSQGELAGLVFAGLAEAARVAGFGVLVKAMDYVTGGRFTPMTYLVAAEATRLGLFMQDEVIHRGGAGPGGHNISRQVRCRRAHSKLFVFTWEPRL